MERRLRRLRVGGFSTFSRSAVAVPPAASIFSRAVSENACAVTVSFLVRSPWPRIFTSVRAFLIRPFSMSASIVTSAPASKRCSSAARFTGTVCVRCGPTGIASLENWPRTFGSRM